MKKFVLALVLTLNSFLAQAGTLSLFVTPAQADLDFSTPSQMMKTFGLSFIKGVLGDKIARLQKSGIGHIIALQ